MAKNIRFNQARSMRQRLVIQKRETSETAQEAATNPRARRAVLGSRRTTGEFEFAQI